MAVSVIEKIRKRDGKIAKFDKQKITMAILHAAQAVGGKDRKLAEKLSAKVLAQLKRQLKPKEIPTIEGIQDIVEKVLIEEGHAKTAKAFIIYRQHRAEIRKEKTRILEKAELDEVDRNFDLNSLRVLKSRYLRKDEQGKLIETPKELFTRVAVHVSLPNIFFDSKVYDKTASSKIHSFEEFDETEFDEKISIGKFKLNKYHLEALKRMFERFNSEKKMKLCWSDFLELFKENHFDSVEKDINVFFDLMVGKKFLPNTPAIANFGASLGMGSACFVLNIDDSIESIMETLKKTAVVFKAGGGMGYNFSNLRPEGDFVSTTSGLASGPLSFMRLFDTMTDVIKQGGIRRGANMGILNCLAGNTMISTLEGQKTIKELVGTRPFLYCLNENNEIRIRKANKVIHSGKKEIVRVRFDDDTHLNCTPDHRIMLSTGQYREARHLKTFDSIMAFHKKVFNERYHIGATACNLVPEHIIAAECNSGIMVCQTAEKRKAADLCIHHKDDNQLNNNPDNLQVLTISQHAKIHSSVLIENQKQIAQHRKGKTIEEMYGKEKADSWKKKMSEARKNRKPWNKDFCGDEYKKHYENGFKNQFSLNNHKVISVEMLSEKQDIYDIIMDEYHNFVANGIFVHNSNHPDIEKFITAKEGNKSLRNFNISVLIMPDFWEYYEKNEPYPLLNPRNGNVVRTVNPKLLFDMIVFQAWESAEPGVIFYDHVNKYNPFMKSLGPIVTTNPCGEVLLYGNESCNLGSVNVWQFVSEDDTGKVSVDWDKLKETTTNATRFLDNVIDVNKYPLKDIEEMTLSTRKIGLGIMGLGDLLFELGLPYNSDEGRKFMEQIIEFVNYWSKVCSVDLAREKGSFPLFQKSFYPDGRLPFKGFECKEDWHFDWNKLTEDIQEHGLRNGFTTVIAPTGSISMIAECSSGIEPVYSLVFEKNVKVGSFFYIDPVFEKSMRREGLYDDDLMREIAEHNGTIQTLAYIPPKMKKTFVTAMDIKPEAHILALASVQKWVDSSISKTNNFPANATVDDMRESYLLAYKLGCKDVTVYRDKSIQDQVLVALQKKETTVENGNTEIQSKTIQSSSTIQLTQPLQQQPLELKELKYCPNCKMKLVKKEGCLSCLECGWGLCK